MAQAIATSQEVKALPQNADPRTSVAEAVAGHDAVLEPKYDGWRILARTDENGKTRTYTRTGNELTGSMPAIEAELQRVLPPGSTLDAEVVAFSVENGMLVQHCNKVQSILGCSTTKAALSSGALSLVVFDLLSHGGHDARALSYAKRRDLLVKLFEIAEFDPKQIMLTPQLEPTDENYETLLANGYEGGMVKWLDAPYASNKRGAGWFKLKAKATVDAIIVGYKDGTPGSSFDGMIGAVEFGQYDADGILVHRGRCSGMDWNVRKAISDDREGHLNRVFELSHMGVLKPENGDEARFRHPNFKRFRPDKPAEQVTIHDA